MILKNFLTKRTEIDDYKNELCNSFFSHKLNLKNQISYTRKNSLDINFLAIGYTLCRNRRL